MHTWSIAPSTYLKKKCSELSRKIEKDMMCVAFKYTSQRVWRIKIKKGLKFEIIKL